MSATAPITASTTSSTSDATQNKRVSIPWPWYSVNDLLDTLRVGTLTVLIADTGFGKTTIVEQCAAFWSDNNTPTRVAGTELSGSELIGRIAARELGLDIAALLRKDYAGAAKDNTLSPEELKAQVIAQCKAIKARLSLCTFYDKEMPSVSDLVADMKAWVAKVGPGGVYVLDHIGQVDMGAMAGKPEAFRQALVAFKTVSKDLGFAVLCPVQLNREGRKAIHNFQSPDLSYAQGSSAIEQMANTVVFLSNPPAPKYSDPQNLREGVKALRSGLLKYEDLVDSSVVQWHCLKSRDLGKRLAAGRGQYSSRPLKFDGNYYVSPRLHALRSLMPTREFSDTKALPTLDQILHDDALGALTEKETNAIKGQLTLDSMVN